MVKLVFVKIKEIFVVENTLRRLSESKRSVTLEKPKRKSTESLTL